MNKLIMTHNNKNYDNNDNNNHYNNTNKPLNRDLIC